VCNKQALSRGLNDGVRLWSEDLAEAGYQLHFSGKWHVSVEESPKDRGWNEHFVSCAAGAHHGVYWDHYQELAKEPQNTDRGESEILRPGYRDYRLYGTGPDSGNGHDEQATDAALRVLDDVANSNDPWCLYVGLVAPHDPYTPARKYLDMYDIDDVPLPPSYADDLADKPRIYRRMRDQIFGQLSEREVREGIRHFWAYCTYLDELFGRMLAKLDQIGQAQDTLVIYCSDHADYCGEHGLFAKGIPSFRGAYNVPVVMRWPAGIANPGRRVDNFVSHVDFYPTFLDLAGRQHPPRLAGSSLVPFLQDREPESWRDSVCTQCNGVELYYTQRSVMTKEYKYVFNGFDLDELYDLRSDPHETRNLAADPTYEQIKRHLCRRMWRFAYEQEDDAALNPYITVGLAPYGPAEAFKESG
jgi:arylsulfatase A-like enzyme